MGGQLWNWFYTETFSNDLLLLVNWLCNKTQEDTGHLLKVMCFTCHVFFFLPILRFAIVCNCLILFETVPKNRHLSTRVVFLICCGLLVTWNIMKDHNDHMTREILCRSLPCSAWHSASPNVTKATRPDTVILKVLATLGGHEGLHRSSRGTNKQQFHVSSQEGNSANQCEYSNRETSQFDLLEEGK